MGEKSQVKAVSPSKRRGRAKIYVLLGLILAVAVSVQTGLFGFGLAHLRAATFPQDESLLEYVPATTAGVLIIDPHQVDLAALGAEGGAARAYLTRTREEIKKAAGIDLAFDVDKLVIAPGLVVARGRFSHRRLADQLREHGYAEAEHKGAKLLVRPREDALAVIGGDILLYGDEAALRAAIDTEEAGTSLAEQDPVTDRLDAVGWAHPVLATVQISDQKPSIKEILAGSTGPRAVTLGLSMKGGLQLAVAIESASPTAAEELRKLLEEKKGSADALRDLAGPELGPVLAEVAKRAKITAQPDSSQLSIRADLSPEELDRVVKVVDEATAPLAEIYKDVRLFQLLVPLP